jgi:purine-cytosine permease-like protein
LVEYSLEARGIERVQEHERIPKLTWVSYLQVFLLWMSVNLAANNITLGMLGPAVYGLSFLDSALCAVFGALVGATAASWMATWGPISGIRTMVLSKPLGVISHGSDAYRLLDGIQWDGGRASLS